MGPPNGIGEDKGAADQRLRGNKETRELTSKRTPRGAASWSSRADQSQAIRGQADRHPALGQEALLPLALATHDRRELPVMGTTLETMRCGESLPAPKINCGVCLRRYKARFGCHCPSCFWNHSAFELAHQNPRADTLTERYRVRPSFPGEYTADLIHSQLTDWLLPSLYLVNPKLSFGEAPSVALRPIRTVGRPIPLRLAPFASRPVAVSLPLPQPTSRRMPRAHHPE